MCGIRRSPLRPRHAWAPYLDADGEVIASTGFEDPSEDLGGYYQSPAAEQVGTYTIEVFDSYGDGGHAITASMDGMTLCSIGQYAYTSYDSCTFDAEGYPGDMLDVDVDTDSYASEGSMTITFFFARQRMAGLRGANRKACDCKFAGCG